MSARVVMIQGTGSNVGKSLIAAGLCRAFANRGLSVAPFKPQNMSNNAAVCAGGGEIGRAQALQAQAAGRAPVVEMNPILLKPESERGAQVIVRGRRGETLTARDYFRRRAEFLPAVLESFHALCATADLVIVEGAGSPAEINLRDGDIANMGFARAVGAPVVLVGDIHRGGVLAAMAGTLQIVDEADARLIEGIIINNFHGDTALFEDGVRFLEAHTGRPCLGVVPHFAPARLLPAEDAVALKEATKGADGSIHIAVPRLPRIANFDDLDPLRMEPGVRLSIISPGEALPGDAQIVILPGTKSTISDLAFVRAQGWDIDIAAHVRRGGRVLGICGGYQMLGRRICDPLGLEGPAGASVTGLGLLDVETVLEKDKTTRVTRAVHAPSGAPIRAYEIHMGQTAGADCARPFAHVEGRPEGAVRADGLVAGSYLHGAFVSDAFRRAWLAGLGGAPDAGPGYTARVEEALEGLAAHLAAHVDLDTLLDLARLPRDGKDCKRGKGQV